MAELGRRGAGRPGGECAGGDAGAPAVSVAAGEGQRAAADLLHPADAADHAGESDRVGAVEGHVVGGGAANRDVPRDAARYAAVADLETCQCLPAPAGDADARAAGIGIVPRQDEEIGVVCARHSEVPGPLITPLM